MKLLAHLCEDLRVLGVESSPVESNAVDFRRRKAQVFENYLKRISAANVLTGDGPTLHGL